MRLVVNAVDNFEVKCIDITEVTRAGPDQGPLRVVDMRTNLTGLVFLGVRLWFDQPIWSNEPISRWHLLWYVYADIKERRFDLGTLLACVSQPAFPVRPRLFSPWISLNAIEKWGSTYCDKRCQVIIMFQVPLLGLNCQCPTQPEEESWCDKKWAHGGYPRGRRPEVNGVPGGKIRAERCRFSSASNYSERTFSGMSGRCTTKRKSDAVVSVSRRADYDERVTENWGSLVEEGRTNKQPCFLRFVFFSALPSRQIPLYLENREDD